MRTETFSYGEITVMIAIIFLATCILCGWVDKVDAQRDAVENGHATYVSDANGCPEFKWNDPCTLK
jgi:hypothetical protein